MDQILYLHHRPALANERVERGRRLILALQQIDLARQLPAIRRPAHPHQQLVAEERLLHEVDRAELHGFDGGIDGAETCHDDERRVDVRRAQLGQQVQAREARHPHVGEDDVEDVAARQIQSFLAARGGLNRVA